MYFKSPDNRPKPEIRIPIGYHGNAFSESSGKKDIPPMPPTPKLSVQKDRAEPIIPQKPDWEHEAVPVCEHNCKRCDESDEKPKQIISPSNSHEKPPALFGDAGTLDSEELLLLTLALIIFQGGKENELALLLLALLFIK